MPGTEMDRLLDQARIRLPGAVDAAIIPELTSVLREFFSGSNVWREEITFPVFATSSNIFLDPDDFAYDLVPSEGAILRLLGVRTASGTGIHARMPVPGTVLLSVSPSSDTDYIAAVVLTVAPPAPSTVPTAPEWVVERHHDVLLDGLLGRMMSQLAKPYSSPSIAAVHLRRFKRGTAEAKVEANRGNVYAAPSWRFPGAFGN